MVQVLYDEINVYGPMTHYGTVYDSSDGMEFALSNMICEGFILGYAGLDADGIMVVSSSSGVMSLRSIVSLEAEVPEESSKSFLDSLLEPLPGDRQTKQLIFLKMFLVLLRLFLIVKD